MNLYEAILEMTEIENTDAHMLVLKVIFDQRGPFTVHDLSRTTALESISRQELLAIIRRFARKGLISTPELAQWGRDPYLVAYQHV